MSLNEWRRIRLGDFIRLQRGHDLPEPQRKAGKIPILGSFGITGYHNEAKAKGPGVTIGRSGGSFGVVTYSPVDYWPLNTALYVTDFQGNDEKFVYYYLKSVDFSGYNSGSAQPSLNRNFIYKIHVNVPLPSEQRAIARVLAALDDKIEVNHQMNHTIESIVQSVFKSWFVDFDPVTAKAAGRAPFGMNTDTAALFPSRFVESQLGLIPEGWQASNLNALFPQNKNVVLTGPFGSHLHAHDYRDKGVPLILVKHVNGGHISENDLPLVGNHKVPELDRYRLKTGDIVFTRVGAVGRSAYVNPRFEGWLISGQMLRIRVPSNNILVSRYLAQVYLQLEFIDMVESHALGTTRPSLNTGLLQAFRFIVPSFEIQKAFAEFVAALDERAQSNLAESNSLVSLRDYLLPKLLSGEIRIGQAEKVVAEAV